MKLRKILSSGILCFLSVLSVTYAENPPFSFTPRVEMQKVETPYGAYRKVVLKSEGSVCEEHKITSQTRQKLIDNAVRAWADFGYQVYDLSSRLTHSFPGGDHYSIAPEHLNQWKEPQIVPRLLRVGHWEDNRKYDVAIGSFWAITPQAKYYLNRQNNVWAAADTAGWADPWSAAFISWVMCETGLPMADFFRSSSHYQYVDDAINGDTTVYKALTREDAKIPQLGDLICADRKSQNTYKTLQDRVSDVGQPRPLHCDLVVNVDVRKNRVFAIGGNVGNSVALTVARLKDNQLEYTEFRPWFTVLRWQKGGKATFDTSLEKAQKGR